MLFCDTMACVDTGARPGNRKQPCLHCDLAWEYHNGWLCHASVNNPHGNWNMCTMPTDLDYIYFTESMRDAMSLYQPSTYGYIKAKIPQWGMLKVPHSRVPIVPAPPAHPDVKIETPTDCSWLAWREVLRAPDECACGIRRAQCDYHR